MSPRSGQRWGRIHSKGRDKVIIMSVPPDPGPLTVLDERTLVARRIGRRELLEKWKLLGDAREGPRVCEACGARLSESRKPAVLVGMQWFHKTCMEGRKT